MSKEQEADPNYGDQPLAELVIKMQERIDALEADKAAWIQEAERQAVRAIRAEQGWPPAAKP